MVNKVLHGDCLDLMHDIPAGSVDMILCDLPYGTTACSWDTIIPFEPLWSHYKRLIKPNGAIVLTASQPFTSKLVMSNLDMFKYEMIWEKTRPLDFFNAKNKPMKIHENIVIFSKGTCANRSNNLMKYIPQGITKVNRRVRGIKECKQDREGHKFARKSHKAVRNQTHTNYPLSILLSKSEGSTIHPTQKPVALFEYLVRTYTNKGDTVLDNCAGSGTTAIACIKTDRNYILIEQEQKYIDIINKRIKQETAQGKLNFDEQSFDSAFSAVADKAITD